MAYLNPKTHVPIVFFNLLSCCKLKTGVTKRLNKRHLVIAVLSAVRIARAFCLSRLFLRLTYC